jgi:hypothetical protein
MHCYGKKSKNCRLKNIGQNFRRRRMFCLEFGVKTVEFQAECQAPPNDLPGVWGENSRIPGGMLGAAECFAWSLG